MLTPGARSNWTPWIESTIVLCLSVTATAAYALYVGQDWNWDTRNYHLYVVHAWLTDRMFYDLAPAQVQTWINPAILLPQYALIQHTPPRVAGALLGALAGLNAVPLWVLVRRLQAWEISRLARMSAACVVIVGLTGSMFVSMTGTTFAEPIGTPFVLASLACLIAAPATPVTTRRFLLSGLLLGIACGLKLTHLAFALGLSAALLALWPFARWQVAALAAYAVGGLAGFAATGGYWAAKMWWAFDNPFFPYVNGVFRSSWIEPTNWADSRFVIPAFFHTFFVYPFTWLVGNHPTNELPFREPRFALVAVLLLLAVLVPMLRARTPQRVVRSTMLPAAQAINFWLLALFFLFSFAIWLKQFGIQRFVLPLEVLSGVLLLISVERLVANRRMAVATLTSLMVCALMWTQASDWGHIPYGASWFGIQPPPLSSTPTLYLMMDREPSSYVIPFLPRNERFVRLESNNPLEPGRYLGRRAEAIIGAHRGPMRTLTIRADSEQEAMTLHAFGLAKSTAGCTTFQARTDTFVTCPVTRIGGN